MTSSSTINRDTIPNPSLEQAASAISTNTSTYVRASSTASSSSSITSAPSIRSSSSSFFRSYSRSSSGTLPSGIIGMGVGGTVGKNSGGTNTGAGSSENLPPRTLARVARDVRDLVKNPPEGVRLVLDKETGMPGSLSEILAEIEGPEQTPYHTRYFQLKLVLSTDFPSTPPRGYFLTKIYHPNVDPSSGAICVNTLKRDWTPTTSLSHVLTVIRCLLIIPFPESSLNDEAGKNFMESYDEYARRARLMAGVHGMLSWSSHVEDAKENDGAMKRDEGKESLPNASKGVKVGKTVNRTNIVRQTSKTMDKKNKKKGLKRL